MLYYMQGKGVFACDSFKSRFLTLPFLFFILAVNA